MIFDELDIQYTEIDNFLATAEFNARAASDVVLEQEYQRKRELNDQAYFLFIFTRLEDRIQQLSTNLFNNKISATADAKEQLGWKMLRDKKRNLMERVSFFATSGGTDYNLIDGYKQKRNLVAHGSFASGIDIAVILTDMKRLYVDLDN